MANSKNQSLIRNIPFEETSNLKTTLSFPVVGIGASAGGLEAFTNLLRALPIDTGMAFVLVQHLAPTHQSALAEILSQATSMPVTEVVSETEIQPNHVYVIPPGKNMILDGAHLQLFQRKAHGQQHPIDLFFRSLGESQREMSIGVVLSGTASDGTVGLESIKAEGGITFAQDDSANQESMPRSAIASGCVDFILSPEEIALEIARISTHPFITGRLLGGNFGTDLKRDTILPDRDAVTPVLSLLKNSTDVDFSLYKINTLARRIARRMVLLKMKGIETYEQFLMDTPTEVQALYQDILINVTNFFRDSTPFDALKSKIIPALLRDRDRNEPLRIWVPGCSTGEEAYSLAMIVSEVIELSNRGVPVQIFATDLNATCIDQARVGVYSKQRLENVSQERQSKFFTENNGGLRVNKSIRDMCVFAQHNVLSDPPFSHMDLVSCRNLLIYIEPSFQQSVIPIFHYSLKPKGVLILGSSETVNPHRDLFEVDDAKNKIFIKKAATGRLPLGMPSSKISRSVLPHKGLTLQKPPRLDLEFGMDINCEADRLLLMRYAPTGVLIDAEFNIVQFRGNTEPYLVPAQGKASLSVLKMAREGMLMPLQTLLSKAKKTSASVREDRLPLKINGESREVTLEVIPLKGNSSSESGFFVLFEETSGKASAVEMGVETTSPSISSSFPDANAAQLKHELARTHEYLQALIEQHDVKNEELQSSNEEAQSANEELQSMNEELETSKEEIQSSNEELSTVNDELQNRNLELAQLNSDLANLIESVQIAIVMVGRDLRIRRLSPMAEKILNIEKTDIGRPITDLHLQLDLPSLSRLLLETIETISSRECEVQDERGHWYLLRTRPYITLDNKIDGAVLSLLDVDVIRSARDYAENIVETVHEPLLVLDKELCIRSASTAFYEIFQLNREKTEGVPLHELGRGEWNIPELRTLLQRCLNQELSVKDFEVRKEFDNIGERILFINARRMLQTVNQSPLVVLAINDVTKHKHLEDNLKRRNEELAAADSGKNHFLATLAHELRSPLNAILGWTKLIQRPDRSAENLQQGLEVIDRSSRAQACLISDLLHMNRISSGKMRLVVTTMNLCHAVRSAVEAIEPAAEGKDIKIESDILGEPILVLADANRLQQVLGNLLGNAIKFTPSQGVIRVILKKSESQAEISIQDTGEGVASDVLPYIFHRFRQADPSKSRAHGGLGLGLSIAKQLVELHGGTISAQSAGPDQGTTFIITLPLLSKIETNHPRALSEAGAEIPPRSLSGIMVLIVEDDVDAREPLRLFLESVGAEVVAVASANEAIEVIRQQRPDILVSDIGMPGRDGYDLISSIRSLPKEWGGETPAIALTAYCSTDDMARALEAGFQMHLVKPVEPARLTAIIASLLPIQIENEM